MEARSKSENDLLGFSENVLWDLGQRLRRGRFSFHLQTSNGKPRLFTMSDVPQNTTATWLPTAATRQYEIDYERDEAITNVQCSRSDRNQCGLAGVLTHWWCTGTCLRQKQVRCRSQTRYPACCIWRHILHKTSDVAQIVSLSIFSAPCCGFLWLTTKGDVSLNASLFHAVNVKGDQELSMSENGKESTMKVP